MIVDWPKFESWYELNQSLSEKFAIDEAKQTLRVFRGLQLGLIEVAMGLAQVYSHRKVVAVDSSFTPFFETMSIQLSKRGFKVEELGGKTPEGSKEFFDQNKKDLLMCVSSCEDPALGVNNPNHNVLKELSDKARTFFVESIHGSTSFKDEVAGKREIKLFSLGDSICLALYGSKVQIKEFIAPAENWDTEIMITVETLSGSMGEDQSRIESFEENSIAGSKALLEKGVERSYNRALIYWEDVDTYGLLGLLKEEFSGVEPLKLSTTSLCYWNAPQTWDYLLKRGFTEKQLRGLLVVPVEAIDDQLPKTLTKAIEKLRSLQNFSSTV